MDAVWDGRSYGSDDKTGTWVRRSVHGRGNFGGECDGAPHYNQWRVCGVTVRKCVNRRSCGLGLCVGSTEALVATRPVPKLLWTILSLLLGRSVASLTLVVCVSKHSKTA